MITIHQAPSGAYKGGFTLITEKCDLLVNNRTAIAKKFSGENNLMCIAAGVIYTMADENVDIEKMAECRKLLKEQAGFFSELRKMAELIILSKMTLSEDPKKYVSDLKSVYDKVKNAKFKDSPYLVLACVIICDLGVSDDCDKIIEKAKEIMDRMEKEHPILTSKSDFSFIMFLALSYKDVDTILKDMEEGYDYLKNTYKLNVTGNAMQGLCELLAVTYGEMQSKCDRVVRIYKTFKNHKSAYGSDAEFSTLGILADIDESPEKLVDEIIEAADYLKEQSGFTDKVSDRKQRLMYATLLVADVYSRNADVLHNPLISNTLSILTTQRIVKTITVLVNIATQVLPAVLDGATSTSSTDSAKAGDDK